MSSKKIKNLLNSSTIKILMLLSTIIILILIYLKLNNKELFRTAADINNYFDKYFIIQDLYKTLQSKLDEESIIINELSNDIQTVLDGEIIKAKPIAPAATPAATPVATPVATPTSM